MRNSVFGPELNQMVIIVKNAEHYEILMTAMLEAFDGIKHVSIEVYKHDDDLHVVSLIYPLRHDDMRILMCQALQAFGYTIAQYSCNGGLNYMEEIKK